MKEVDADQPAKFIDQNGQTNECDWITSDEKMVNK